MNQQTNGIYEFGSFRLDRQERLLQCDGAPISLTPKAFDLLLALIERHGHLLEKEVLLRLVWPDSFVEEANLASNISQLRKALGEGENGQKFIETVPKRGYRFVAEVRQIAPVEEEPPIATPVAEPLSPTMPPVASEQSGQWRRLMLALAGRETAIIAIAALLLLAAAWFFLNRKTTPALAEREPLLLADFENKTGEDIWDGTLKQALAIALEQSPYMNIFPEVQAHSTMKLMNRSVDDPITRAVGREICQRRNVRAFLVGTITKLERSYTVTLEATDAQSGETIARTLEQATGRDEVVNALGRAAKDLREKLGESLASLRKYDAPLVEATTSSLDALKAYSTGLRVLQNGRNFESYSFFRRAIELDEQFALARATLGGRLKNEGAVSAGVEQVEKAWRLREKVSEYERLRINCNSYLDVTGESDKAIEEALILTRTYPQNSVGFNALGVSYRRVGQYTKAEVAFREGFRLQPESSAARLNAAFALIQQNRYDDAKELYEQVVMNTPETVYGHFFLANIAYAQNKTEELSRQIEWFAGKPSVFQGQLLQARIKASAGQRRQADEFYLQAAQLAGARNQLENQIGLLSEGASVNALFGQTAKAAEQAARALSMQQNGQRNGNYLLKGHFYGLWAQTFVGWVFALSGDAAHAQSLTDELVRENPKNTLILSVIAPLTRATIELQRGNPAQAIELLQPAIPYEAAPDSSLFRPNWIRGRAYLQLKQGAAAATEFQKIIDHRGWDMTSPLWPLAALGLARAAVLQGDTAKAKQRYDEFFRLWKDADADLPVLIEAKKEYEKVK